HPSSPSRPVDTARKSSTKGGRGCIQLYQLRRYIRLVPDMRSAQTNVTASDSYIGSKLIGREPRLGRLPARSCRRWVKCSGRRRIEMTARPMRGSPPHPPSARLRAVAAASNRYQPAFTNVHVDIDYADR